MDAVVGRDRELEEIGSFLDRGATAPGVLVLEGEPGIGKTTLWRAAVDAARARGFRVLSCAGSGSEAQLSFAAVHDLLGEVFDEVTDELPPPQRRALAVTLLREEPDGPPPEQSAIAVAVLTALRALAAREPTMVAVDDVHWLDGTSAVALGYALRRLEPESLPVLLAQRVGERDALALRQLEPERIRVVRLAPLTIGALSRILFARLGQTYPRPILHRLGDASRGNPFVTLELGRALAAAATPLDPGAPLPVPKTLRNLLRRRLRELEPDTLEALALASALSRPSLETIGAALDRDPLPLLAPAIDAQVVEVEDGQVHFAHPLFATAVYEHTPEERRRDLHRRLSGVVQDPEERARHLAFATVDHDEDVARVVEEAARTAFALGRPAGAAELAAQARRLTPPAEGGEAGRRALFQVDCHFAAGDTARAAALLEELLAAAPAGTARARLLSRRARLAHFGDDIAASVTLLRQALAEADDDVALRADVEEGLAWGLLLARKDLPAAAAHARSAARLNQERGDDAALAEALAAQALLDFALGGEWRATMARALELEPATLHLPVLRHPTFAHGYCLSCSDEHDQARAAFAELRRRALEQGDEGGMPSILNHLALIECLGGRWITARELADDGFTLARETGQLPTQASIGAKRALLAALRGDVEEARDAAWEALRLAGGPDFDLAHVEPVLARGGETAVWTLGLLELSLDHPADAVQALEPLCTALLAAGIEEPGEVRALPDLIEALVAVEQVDEAAELLEHLDRWARRLDRPSTLARVARCRGLLLTATGKTASGLAALEEAADWHERASLPFERGRTLLALGTARRRAQQRRLARETLEQALAAFDELGARLWAAKARAELGRIGGRAPSSGELTPSEQRVAELVAQGKTNQEVAAALVVSVHTVEAALTQVYRKLGVRSRTELARSFTAPEG